MITNKMESSYARPLKNEVEFNYIPNNMKDDGSLKGKSI